MHTGRHNFLHRSWGPLEPFDESMPQALDKRGIHSHKVTDHYHYWEDGGATYHNRFTTYDFVRGQEGDKWKADVAKLRDIKYGAGRWSELQSMKNQRQDNINREYMPTYQEQPQHHTFNLGLEFIERNASEDGWYLQIETFDPHEPFFTHEEFQRLYPHEYDGPPFDWPTYREVREDEQTVQHMRYMYASLVSFCDYQLGRVLDIFDRLDLWKDTMLIVNTDHGFMLGEHDWWGKLAMPFFQEVAHIPFWIYDPRHPDAGGRRSEALSTTIDIAPTVLSFFNVRLPAFTQGKSLEARVADLQSPPARSCAIYGMFGGHVNVTDGRYVYMRGPASEENGPLYEYTLMPTHLGSHFLPSELTNWERHDGFSFTKECKIMKVPSRSIIRKAETHPVGKGKMATMLFDVVADPGMISPLADTDIEAHMIKLLIQAMIDGDAPPEQYTRLGLPSPGHVSTQTVQQACVLETARGKRYRELGIEGAPLMPFFATVVPGGPKINFPDNLRLRPGYVFSRDGKPPVLSKL